MISQSVRNAVWYDLVSSQRVVRYYAALADRYHRYDRWLQYLSLVSATGCLGAWLNLFPPVWQSTVAAVASSGVVLFVLWSILAKTAWTEAALRSVLLQCQRVEDARQALWIDVNRDSCIEGRLSETPR